MKNYEHQNPRQYFVTSNFKSPVFVLVKANNVKIRCCKCLIVSCYGFLGYLLNIDTIQILIIKLNTRAQL